MTGIYRTGISVGYHAHVQLVKASRIERVAAQVEVELLHLLSGLQEHRLALLVVIVKPVFQGGTTARDAPVEMQAADSRIITIRLYRTETDLVHTQRQIRRVYLEMGRGLRAAQASCLYVRDVIVYPVFVFCKRLGYRQQRKQT